MSATKNTLVLAVTVMMFCAVATDARADGTDDPLVGMVMIDEFEWRDADPDDKFAWDAEAWLGKDFDKLLFKTEGERADGETEEAELQALYSRLVSVLGSADRLARRFSARTDTQLVRGGIQRTRAVLH